MFLFMMPWTYFFKNKHSIHKNAFCFFFFSFKAGRGSGVEKGGTGQEGENWAGKNRADEKTPKKMGKRERKQEKNGKKNRKKTGKKTGSIYGKNTGYFPERKPERKPEKIYGISYGKKRGKKKFGSSQIL